MCIEKCIRLLWLASYTTAKSFQLEMDSTLDIVMLLAGSDDHLPK